MGLNKKFLRLNNKGFSLIELIAVLIIMSIVILIAMPKFTPYKTYSDETKLKQQILEVEHQVKKTILQNNLDKWNKVSQISNEELWTSKGIDENVESGQYLEIPRNLIDSKLNGSFYLRKGKIYYSKEKLVVDEKDPDNEETPDGDSGQPQLPVVNKIRLFELMNIANGLNREDYDKGWLALESTLIKSQEIYLNNSVSQEKVDRVYMLLEDAIHKLETKEIPIVPIIKWEVAKDEDFEWEYEILTGYYAYGKIFRGCYKYIGNKEYVVIPDNIKGNKMDSYRRMFENNKIIKGVSNTSSYVNSAINMFSGVNTESLDLSKLDVSNVHNLSGIFSYVKINKSLNLNGWDTKNVSNMESMFYGSKITEINFGQFNLSKTIYMSYMFKYLDTDILDLSGFDFTKKDIYITETFKDIVVNKLYVKNKANKNKITSISKINKNAISIK